METEKCTKLYVVTVEKKRKFRSSQMAQDRFIVRNAIEIIGPHEEVINKFGCEK